MSDALTSQQLLHNSYHLAIRSSLLAIQSTLSLQKSMLQSQHTTFTDIKSVIVSQNTTLQNITKTLVDTFSKISSFQPPSSPSTFKPPLMSSETNATLPHNPCSLPSTPAATLPGLPPPFAPATTIAAATISTAAPLTSAAATPPITSPIPTPPSTPSVCLVPPTPPHVAAASYTPSTSPSDHTRTDAAPPTMTSIPTPVVILPGSPSPIAVAALKPSIPPPTTITTTTTSLSMTTNPHSMPRPPIPRAPTVPKQSTVPPYNRPSPSFLGSLPLPSTPLFAIDCIIASPSNPSTSTQNIHPPSLLGNKTKTINPELQQNLSLQSSDLKKLKLNLVSPESMVSPYLGPCPSLPFNISTTVNKLSENTTTPSRASSIPVRYDLSNASETKMPAQGKALVPTNLNILIPNSTYSNLAPRSDLTWKQSVNVGAVVINANYVDSKLNIGDRIALVERIEKYEAVEESIPYNCIFLAAFEYFHDSTFGLCGPIPSNGENGSYGFFDVDQTDVLALDWNEDEKKVFVFDPGGSTFDIKGRFVIWFKYVEWHNRNGREKKTLDKCYKCISTLRTRSFFEGMVMIRITICIH